MMVLKCPRCGKEGPPVEERPVDEPVTIMTTLCSDCIVLTKRVDPPKESE